MINTLLEHVPIKMEVKDIDETTGNPSNDEVAEDDDKINETDEELDDDDDDEEETDTESDALEIEQEATMLISSDEEAELEAQRIRFPDIAITKKIHEGSDTSSRSSSRNSLCSNTSSKTHITYEIITRKVTMEEIDNKQRISPRLNNTESNNSLVICNKENDNNPQTMLKSKKEKKKVDNNTALENNKNKQSETAKYLDNNKAIADSHKKSDIYLKSPANVPGHNSRRGSNNSACSIASTVGSESAETECCGNIYVFNLQQKLIFNCEYCDLKYGDLENFARHLHEAHKLFNLDEGPEKENAPRNLPKTNRITNNAPKTSANVKKEPLQPFELLAEPPVVLPPAVLAEPLDSCGNVFMLNHRKLFLVCGYCDCKYANLDLFEKHLRQQHRIFEGWRNELNVVPKIEIKEEEDAIAEVIDKPKVIVPQAMVAIPAEIPSNITPQIETESKANTLEETEKTSEEVNKEQSTSSAAVIVTETLESNITKVLEKPVEVNEISNTKENENAEKVNEEITTPMEVVNNDISTIEEAVSNEISAIKEVVTNEIVSPKETRSKRRSSSPVSETPSNKRHKRNKQNNTKAENEPTTKRKADNLPDKVSEISQIMEIEDKITEILETKETEDVSKSSALESVKATIAETIETTEAIKPKQITESETTLSIKATEIAENEKSINEAHTKNETPQVTKETRKTGKAAPSKKRRRSHKTRAKKKSRSAAKPPETKELKQEKTEDEVGAIESKVVATIESKFKCSICPKVLADKNSLKIHERIHNGEKPYECEVCHKRFRNRRNLSYHKRSHHLDETHKIYKCDTCEKKFSHNSHLKKHIMAHSLLQRFKCGICLRGYTLKEHLKQHIDRDHKPGEEVAKSKRKSVRQQIVPCTKVEDEAVPQLSTITSSLIEPMQETVLPQEHNTMNDDLNEDPVNDIIEQLQNEMAENELENGEMNSVTFTINAILPDSEETKKSLATRPIAFDAQLNEIDSAANGQHQLLKVVKRFFCNVCHTTFDKRIRLIEHKRVHTGEKPFTCDECGKQFRVRIRLKEHKLRHSKEKKFICEICQLGCCTKQDLNLHMRHHTNDRRYQCTMCPKAFVRSSDLKIHIRIHTGEKPYVCEICHKCFRANQNLCVHRKSHMGEASKIYKCEHCEKRFMRMIDRKVHMRSHTGEKPYKCQICDRGYSSRVNVRTHIERDHIAAKGGDDTAPKGKRRTGPKPKALKEELEKQKKLIEDLRNQLWQQIKSDEKMIPSDEEMLQQNTLQDSIATDISSLSTISNIDDPIQSAYELLNKLKSSTTTSKPLTAIPSPPPMASPPSNPFTKAKKGSTTLLPLTITQKIEQAPPTPAAPSSSSTSTSCLTTPSPPKTTATKVVSQKTSLGIQQVSVTVSMQVENVTASPASTLEKDNTNILSTSPSGTNSAKKERKITSYFTVVGQKAEV